MAAPNLPFVRKASGLLGGFALAATLLVPAAAFAGEVKFGADPLETDDKGKLTDGGRSAAVDSIASEPGEEVWHAHVWAKIDKGGPGPLYIEFFGKLPNGKPYLTYRHEHGGYQGEPYVSLDVELEGNQGFNKGKTYNVKVTQVSSKGKDLLLASSKLTLTYTEPPEEDEGDEGESDGDQDTAAQDELDTLAGPDEPETGDAPETGGPPAVAPKEKGCSVDPNGFGAPGVLILLALGAGLGRRRRAE